jgi:hypothetical protein
MRRVEPLKIWCLIALNGHGKWEFRPVTARTKRDVMAKCPWIDTWGVNWDVVKASIEVAKP